VPFGAEHLPDFARLADDPAVQRFTLFPVPPPPGFAADWLARYEAGRADGTREAFAIAGERGRFLGVALVVEHDATARTAELGYIVAPEARGRGVATRALRLLTEWTFANLDPLRVELRISADNAASGRAAARCGYVREGVLRSVYFKHGERSDLEIWSRLPTDPDPAR
jgi:RimJ/RimL family protein N-acetyltransferase